MNLYRGLNQQATIIATAPLIGLLGTVDQIMAGCYFGFVGDKSIQPPRPRPGDCNYLVP